MQIELLDRRRWHTRIELVNAMYDYIAIFHNRCRRHSALGWLTRFRRIHARRHASAP